MPAPETIQTAVEIASAIRRGSSTAARTVDACLEQITTHDGALNCFRETWPDHARARAEEIDRLVAAGADPGLLAGVPVAVKDNIATDVGTTACGSRILEGYRSPFQATVVERLHAAGAVLIGKTNCDEFAMGSSTEHSAYGPTLNPWDTGRVPGGSSGGSAAAVAAGLCPAALGSDTGGSIRQPASFCGCVGLKPSYGRVSRYGLVAFGSSLDQVGPLTRNVGDAALLLSVLAGADENDGTSAELPVPDLLGNLETPIEDLRIGVPHQYVSAHDHPAVAAAVIAAANVYRSLGATIVDLSLPLINHGIATYYVLAPAEASSNLARYDGIRYGRRAEPAPGDDLEDLYARSRAEGFGPEVQRRIMLGTYVLSAGYYDAYYLRALQARRLIKADYDRAFEQCHALLGPVSPVPAFRLGEKADPLTMYMCDVHTVNTNIAGICGMSLPGGFAEVDGKRLPIGVQLQCPAFEEETLLRIGRMLERETGFHLERPKLGDR